MDFGGVTCLPPPKWVSWLVQSKVSSGLVVAVTSVLNLEIVKEGEQYIERFSALVTVGVAPILVAMITVRVEIGGYTIQFYQSNHSGIIWDFCIQPNGGVQLNFCTPNGLPIHFQWRVANIYNFSLSTANYLIFRR